LVGQLGIEPRLNEL